MRRSALLFAVALATLAAQTPSKKAASAHIAIAPAPVGRIPQGMLANLERSFDSRLFSLDSKDPLDPLGDGTRGLYIEGYGAIFTTQLSLIVTPGESPFRPTIPDSLKLQVHDRKLAQLPRLREMMKELVKVTALTLAPMPDDQMIVYAVRVRYLPWENTDGLPAQIKMTADKKAAQMGDIKTEVE